MADEAQKRETAVYNRTVAWLRHTQPDLSDEEMDEQGLAAVETAVWGHDAKKDRHGNYIQQGSGAPGNESANHFFAIRKYEGEEAYRRAVAEIWKRDPERAKKLNLPQPRGA
jgi:hypothetical protein